MVRTSLALCVVCMLALTTGCGEDTTTTVLGSGVTVHVLTGTVDSSMLSANRIYTITWDQPTAGPDWGYDIYFSNDSTTWVPGEVVALSGSSISVGGGTKIQWTPNSVTLIDDDASVTGWYYKILLTEP